MIDISSKNPDYYSSEEYISDLMLIHEVLRGENISTYLHTTENSYLILESKFKVNNTMPIVYDTTSINQLLQGIVYQNLYVSNPNETLKTSPIYSIHFPSIVHSSIANNLYYRQFVAIWSLFLSDTPLSSFSNKEIISRILPIIEEVTYTLIDCLRQTGKLSSDIEVGTLPNIESLEDIDEIMGVVGPWLFDMLLSNYNIPLTFKGVYSCDKPSILKPYIADPLVADSLYHMLAPYNLLANYIDSMYLYCGREFSTCFTSKKACTSPYLLTSTKEGYAHSHTDRNILWYPRDKNEASCGVVYTNGIITGYTVNFKCQGDTIIPV